ncbi:MAG: pseudaminic acid synthase, partial [Candidatus Omnitrophota bacterium]
MFDLRRTKKCFIVAEISANHGQSLKRAVSLIRKAKECGADAVKFQTYTPDTLTINDDKKYFQVKHPKWGGQTLYELYEKAYTPWKWFKELKKTAEDLGLVFFSAAFDKSAVDFLEDLGVPCHKISSFEIVDIPLIEYAAKTRKPLILSTGMASFDEVTEAVNAAKKAGAKDIVLLKCVSSYPAEPEDMNLRTIPHLKETFKCPAGLSDHSLGVHAALGAVALGADMVEKHFTLSKRVKTPDSFFSADPVQFKQLVQS